jgi:hypothetical protein
VTTRALVGALATIAARFSPEDRREKLRLVATLARRPIGHGRVLSKLHEALCFLQAYPDDGEVLAMVDRALAEFPARVERLGSAAARRLHDSGIAGTSLDYPFGFPMARWLAFRFAREVEIVWRGFIDEERLLETLSVLLPPAEHDSVSDEGGLGWRRWLEVAKGGRAVTDLELLLSLFDRADLDEPVRDWLFESLGLSIGWRLGGAGASRTFARLQWPHPFFHAGDELAGRRPGARAFRREIERPLPLETAPRPLARRLIDAARLAMATRLREVFAFSYANPDDVLVADPGRGLRVALIGIVPTSRLPYEGYYAYLALKNGVPIGYGAAWQLFGVLEIAVNVFEAFRRGESAFVLSQVLRAYHQAFGMRAVVVDPYQIGHQNPEALRSGAFYFYHRLGFRPRDRAARRLARAELAKIAGNAAYRSPLPVLEQLARSELYLSLAGPGPHHERRVTSSGLATLVTADIARRFHGDRRAAARAASARVAAALGLSRWTEWSPDERRSFEQLALVIALIPDLDRWPAIDRRRLTEVLRAKGGPNEAQYVRLLDRHQRLRRRLEALLASVMR